MRLNLLSPVSVQVKITLLIYYPFCISWVIMEIHDSRVYIFLLLMKIIFFNVYLKQMYVRKDR